MALDLTHGPFFLVELTDRQGRRRPVRIVSEREKLIFVSSVNSSAHCTGVEASSRPIDLPIKLPALRGAKGGAA
jgi:hypothetical protein